MTAADILTLLDPATPDTWPQGILAAADLREQRAKAATREPYVARTSAEDGGAEIAAGSLGWVWLYIGDGEQDIADAEHIAAEANPTHALAAVELWRVVAGWMQEGLGTCPEIEHTNYPDAWANVVAAAADEVRAYLGGAT